MTTLPETERRPLHTDGAPDNSKSPPATIAHPADVASLLELSDERDSRLVRLLAAERAAYRRGYEHGRSSGYSAGRADCDAEWMEALAPARAAAEIAARSPAYAELERRRYGPGGRARAGDPRPGDYPGRRGAAA